MQTIRRIEEIVKLLKSKKLLVEVSDFKKDIELSNISIDSRYIKKDGLFICIKGFITDGHKFVKSAIKNGASAVVCEDFIKVDKNIVRIIVKDSRKAEAVLAAYFYDTRKPNFKLVGITGTNGKTTTAFIMENILTELGYKCGVIGTFGYKIEGKSYPLDRTTPDALELHKIFAEMKDLDYVIMEVSAHALALKRVHGLKYDLAIFTNLTRDHLNFFQNMNAYANAKYKLFKQLKKEGIAIFNTDDYYGKKFYDKFKGNKISISFQKGDYLIKRQKISENGSIFSIAHSKIEISYKTNLIGRFNLYNLSSAIIGVKQIITMEFPNIKRIVKSIKQPEGRLQKVDIEKNVFVDYAHTPDALNNVLATLDDIKKGRIITVFGAGGNRDKEKRPMMYKVAILYSDVVIVTTDNPRDEDPVEILNDIFSQGYNKKKTLVYLDRRTAINVAVRIAKKDDIVLIAGKGHEKYQEIKGEKFHFDDVEEVVKSKEFKPKGNLYIPISLYWVYKSLGKKIPAGFEDEIFYSIYTDSRKLMENSLFFAFKGENFDAHKFVPDILKTYQNVYAIVKRNFARKYKNNKRLIPVSDTIKSYGALAKFYKSAFSPLTIAVTGTVGKTTTKEFLSMIFSKVGSVHKTFGNENNQIGVPKTIFGYKKEDYLILELGTNHPGEIRYLTDITYPDIAIITKIGNSHLEFFGNSDNVYLEKRQIFIHNPKIKIIDVDSMDFINFGYMESIDKNYAKVGFNETADYKISDVEVKGGRTFFKLDGITYSIVTPFETFVKNASFAIVAALKSGVAIKTIKDALNKKLVLDKRMEIIKKNGVVFLNDCYNANPDSMSAAIDFWKKYMPDKKHIAILGDMYELGKKGKFYHRDIGEKLEDIQPDTQIVTVGNLSKYYGSDLHFETVDDLLKSGFVKKISPQTVVLIKGSHGLRLDKIVRSL